jgi:hypothetical protein
VLDPFLRTLPEGFRYAVEIKPALLFVNNRLEGNAPSTIESVFDRLNARSSHGQGSVHGAGP